MIALAMFQKSKGGRGKKADIPYARGSFTLPPELKQYLDAQAEKYGVSMSEMLARILQEHQEMTARPQTSQPAEIPEGESTTPPVGGTLKARTAPKEKEPTQSKQADSTADAIKPVKARASMRAGGKPRTKSERLTTKVAVLKVVQKSVPRGLGWKPERYAQTEELLSHGSILIASGVNYKTARGELMGYRAVEALFGLGVLKPAQSDEE